MLYNKFKDLNLSRLGFGIMRMPTTAPRGPIDREFAAKLIEHAYENGVNYFDTAYFYHNGESERFIGGALAKYPRDTWYLADKFPGNFLNIEDGKLKLNSDSLGMAEATFEGPAEVFEQQLGKCGVDYFDFYLLHNLSENTYDLYTDEKTGIVDYLLKQKKAGRIRYLGLSSHARPETLEKFLDWRNCFEFVQIQLNYLDWSLQEADKKCRILEKHGLPIIVMEPVRGGKLANPGEKAVALLKAARPDDSPAKWAFRFVQSLPNIAVVLSGMNAMEHLNENIELFCNEEPLTESEQLVLQHVVDTMAESVPCTACRYCCGACPQNLDIPLLISIYNEAVVDMTWYVDELMEPLSDGEKPQSCINCGACSRLCPQNIDIPGTMAKFAALLTDIKEP